MCKSNKHLLLKTNVIWGFPSKLKLFLKGGELGGIYYAKVGQQLKTEMEVMSSDEGIPHSNTLL